MRTFLPAVALFAAAIVSCGRPVEKHSEAPPTIHLTGTTLVAPGGASLGGVRVCPYERSDLPCVTSDAAGAFDVLLPANSETAATFVRDDYASVLVPYATASAGIKDVGVSMPVAGDRIATYKVFGAQCPDPTSGFVSAFVGTASTPLGLPGIKVAIGPSSGKGPFYFGEDGTPAPAATSTSTVSAAFFANLALGEATLTYSGPGGLSCKRTFGGWPSPAPNAVRLPVSAGFETHVAMACAAPHRDAVR